MYNHCWPLGLSAQPCFIHTETCVSHSPFWQPGPKKSPWLFSQWPKTFQVRSNLCHFSGAWKIALPFFHEFFSLSLPALFPSEITELFSPLKSSSCSWKPSSIFRTRTRMETLNHFASASSPAFPHNTILPKQRLPGHQQSNARRCNRTSCGWLGVQVGLEIWGLWP